MKKKYQNNNKKEKWQRIDKLKDKSSNLKKKEKKVSKECKK